jgi:PhzF family phenazine biosynthesis protein
MRLSFMTLDVFTTIRYAGNPLAVVTVPSAHRSQLTQTQKQNIAREFNLSETVFVHECAEDSADEVPIDIFTIKAEIPFAGHPTIGTSHYLLHKNPSTKAILTKAGRIGITLDASTNTVSAAVPHNVHIHTASLSGGFGSMSASPYVSIVKGMTFILVRLVDLAALKNAEKSSKHKPYDPEELDKGWREGFTGTYFYVVLGTDAHGRIEVRTRMHGSTEDPATGSAASALACYLALQEPREKEKGPFEFAVTQGVEMGRKSDIGLKVVRNEEGSAIESVTLSGTAVTVMEGNLEVDVEEM